MKAVGATRAGNLPGAETMTKENSKAPVATMMMKMISMMKN
jgi:hypothetical protein